MQVTLEDVRNITKLVRLLEENDLVNWDRMYEECCDEDDERLFKREEIDSVFDRATALYRGRAELAFDSGDQADLFSNCPSVYPGTDRRCSRGNHDGDDHGTFISGNWVTWTT